MPLLALLSVLACTPDPVVDVAESVEIGARLLPEAPKDLLRVDATLTRTTTTTVERRSNAEVTTVTEVLAEGALEPTVLDASGEEVLFEELLDLNGARVGWVPLEDLEPGSYTLTELEAAPLEAPLSFQVSPYGTAEAFDASALVGKAWRFDDGWLVLGTELGFEAAQGWFVVDAVEGDAVDFRILGEMDYRCVLLKGKGSIDGNGVFTWSAASLEAAIEPAPIPVSDLSLRLGFLPDASAIGGAEGRMLLDLRGMDAALAAEEKSGICSVAGGFGLTCDDPCPDGEDACLDVWALNVTASLDPEIDPAANLDFCGADFSEQPELPEFSCDYQWDGTLCSVAPAAMSLYAAALASLLARARRP